MKKVFYNLLLLLLLSAVVTPAIGQNLLIAYEKPDIIFVCGNNDLIVNVKNNSGELAAEQPS